MSPHLGNCFNATFSPVEMCFPSQTTAAPPLPNKLSFLYPTGSQSPYRSLSVSVSTLSAFTGAVAFHFYATNELSSKGNFYSFQIGIGTFIDL